MNRLHRPLPSYYKESKTFKEITRVQNKEFDRVYKDIEDLNKQFLVDTATWGLAIYEKTFGLPIKPNKSFDERRGAIKAKMRGIGKVDFLMIKAIVEAFTGNEATVEFNGVIKIGFTVSIKPLDIENMRRAINEIKPAHLDFVLHLNLKQEKGIHDSDVYVASTTLCGEEITVFPYSITELEVSSKMYIGSGENRGYETVTVYPGKEVI